MLRPRIIPCLLISNGALVKTVQFRNPKYVGDPINAVRIFNEKEVDEIFIANIDCTTHSLEPDLQLIQNLAAECRMPFCYSGGVSNFEHVERIVSLGVEKVALSSAAIKSPILISNSANRVGSQSVVVVVDIRVSRLVSGYEIFTHNGRNSTGICPLEFCKIAEGMGAGEIVINSIDRDGLMTGYDMALVDKIRESVSIPLTVLGGASSLRDIEELIRCYPVIGAAAGSLFVFKGKYRAVLITYPSPQEKEGIFSRALNQSKRL